MFHFFTYIHLRAATTTTTTEKGLFKRYRQLQAILTVQKKTATKYAERKTCAEFTPNQFIDFDKS